MSKKGIPSDVIIKTTMVDNILNLIPKGDNKFNQQQKKATEEFVNNIYLQKSPTEGFTALHENKLIKNVELFMESIIANDTESQLTPEKLDEIHHVIVHHVASKNIPKNLFDSTFEYLKNPEAVKLKKEFDSGMDEIVNEIKGFYFAEDVDTRNEFLEKFGSNANQIVAISQSLVEQYEKDKKSSLTSREDRANHLHENLSKLHEEFSQMETQANKAELGPIKNYLGCALKVIATLGLDKQAKKEFATAKFVMQKENRDKIKELTKDINDRKDTVSKVTTGIKSQAERGR